MRRLLGIIRQSCPATRRRRQGHRQWRAIRNREAAGRSPATARHWSMTTQTKVSERVRFGEFVLDLRARELTRGDEPVALSPKAYQLLEMLVVNRPAALSKTDLQNLLWPDTFVVEKNLANLIGEIRRAIDDNAARPRFIRTVP